MLTKEFASVSYPELGIAPRPSVIHAIYDRMSRSPHAVAVTDGAAEWTYAALRQRSELVARALADNGIAPGSVVGMHLPRRADAIAVMLGIMASGCVYLPLDPSHPASRLRHMLDQAAAVAVMSDSDDPGLYGQGRLWLPVPQPASGTGDGEAEPAARTSDSLPVGPDDRAYILFTSGSTGAPKGVEVTHQNITLLVQWAAEALGLTAADASATTTSLSFDPCFLEMLTPLSVGGTVHVIPHALALGQLTRPVSFVASTPTVASELLRAGLLPSLSALIVGGEALTPNVAARLLSSGRVGRLLNCYGPTECTVCVTAAEITAPVPDVIPIGRPLPGSEVFILDAGGRPVADGQTGEVCISGGQVADGYVGNPAATAERFRVRVRPGTGPERYYRTGDLGYRLADGTICFSGRADRQVKVNGCRIELGEVDAALSSHPHVADAVTTVQGGERLVAYVVPAPDGVDVTDLKGHLAGRLPRYMLPAGVVVLPELPMTVSGKLDEAALPRWSPSRDEHEHEHLAIDECTARVIDIVADVTGFGGQILPTDDFINDLGGTSFGIVRVLAELERDSGRRLRMTDALADTTVAGLASLLRRGSVSSPADFAFNTEGTASPIFFLHAYLGGMLRLRRLAELFPADQPVYGIQVHSTSRPGEQAPSISSLTEDALKRIRAIQPTGRVTMTGHSAGGLIALEAARKLLQAHEPEPRVLMIDAVRPRSTFGYYWGELLISLPEVGHVPFTQQVDRLRTAIRRRRSKPVAADPKDLMAVAERDEVSTNFVISRYRAKMYDGPVTVMRTKHGRLMALGRKDLGWAPVTKGELSLIDVPGTHMSVLDPPHVHVLAAKITNWLASDAPDGDGPSPAVEVNAAVVPEGTDSARALAGAPLAAANLAG